MESTGGDGGAAGDGSGGRQRAGGAPPRVLLLERNGLHHGGFDLRASGGAHSVRSVAWSCDSELLGVVQREAEAGGPGGAWLVQVRRGAARRRRLRARRRCAR